MMNFADDYVRRREIIRTIISVTTGIPKELIKFDESGKYADLSWRMDMRLVERYKSMSYVLADHNISEIRNKVLAALDPEMLTEGF